MSLKPLLFTLALCVGLLSLGGACAHAAPPYELRIETPDGSPLRTFRHQSELFALGRTGERYVLRVVNHSGERVEAVVSVDGRDVLSGGPGNFRTQRGYLVPAYGEVRIEGFRQSLSEVASFRFSDPSDSYSSRMGTPENVGVIGLAVFTEARPEPVVLEQYEPYRDYESQPAPSANRDSHAQYSEGRASAGAPSAAPGDGERKSGADKSRAPSPARPSAAQESSADALGSARDDRSRIGTAYGESRTSHVQEVAFERATPNHPRSVQTLRYDSRSGLLARGIVVDPPRPRPQPTPSAFPMSRFAPPPPVRTAMYE